MGQSTIVYLIVGNGEGEVAMEEDQITKPSCIRIFKDVCSGYEMLTNFTPQSVLKYLAGITLPITNLLKTGGGGPCPNAAAAAMDNGNSRSI